MSTGSREKDNVMKKEYWITGLIVLALGLSACSSGSKNPNGTPNPLKSGKGSVVSTDHPVSMDSPRDTATKFALYVVSEKLLTPSRQGVPFRGVSVDNGVSSTEVSWNLIPEPGGILLCVIAKPTGSAQSAQKAFVGLFELMTNTSLSQGRMAFGLQGVTNCAQGQKQLVNYKLSASTSTSPVADFISGLKVKDLDSYTLTAKGKSSYEAFSRGGDFLSRQAKIDDIAISELNKIGAFILKPLAAKSLGGAQLDGLQSTSGRLLDTKKNTSIVIPARTYAQYSTATGDYCFSMDGWQLSKKRGAVSRGLCNEALVQAALVQDANLAKASINSFVAGKKIYATWTINLDDSNLLTISPSTTGETFQKKLPLHAGTVLAHPVVIDSAGLWCLELDNGGDSVVVNSNLIMAGAMECPATNTVSAPASKTVKAKSKP
jgi:hypothetical protein